MHGGPQATAIGAHKRLALQGSGLAQGVAHSCTAARRQGTDRDCGSLSRGGERQGNSKGLMASPAPSRQCHSTKCTPGTGSSDVCCWLLVRRSAASFALAAASAAAARGGRLVFAAAPPALVWLFRREVDHVCRAEAGPHGVGQVCGSQTGAWPSLRGHPTWAAAGMRRSSTEPRFGGSKSAVACRAAPRPPRTRRGLVAAAGARGAARRRCAAIHLCCCLAARAGGVPALVGGDADAAGGHLRRDVALDHLHIDGTGVAVRKGQHERSCSAEALRHDGPAGCQARNPGECRGAAGQGPQSTEGDLPRTSFGCACRCWPQG